MMQSEIKKVFSFVNPDFNSWDLTYDEEAAKKDPLHSLVSIEDLHDFVAMASYIFDGLIQTTEGIVKWFEQTTLDDQGFEDYIGEYRIVN